MDERVLAVPRDALFTGGLSFTGFSPAERFDFTERILSHRRYLLRFGTSPGQERPAEEDPRFKQVIPYCLFHHRGKLFLYERLSSSGDRRTHGLVSIGIGGHMNEADAAASPGKGIFEAAMRREFGEEVRYPAAFSARLLGFINDESDTLNAVHFGVVYLLSGESPAISVRERDGMRGRLVPLGEVFGMRDRLERWSGICADHLLENPPLLTASRRSQG